MEKKRQETRMCVTEGETTVKEREKEYMDWSMHGVLQCPQESLKQVSGAPPRYVEEGQASRDADATRRWMERLPGTA